MKKRNVETVQEAYNRGRSEQRKRYEQMLEALDERKKTDKLSSESYDEEREALQRYNPDYACYFSEHEPEWMKPIKSDYRASLSRQLALPSMEDDLGRIIAKPLTALLYGSGITIIDVCIFGAMRLVPRQYHYITMLAVPITNIPMLYCLFSTCRSITADNNERVKQLAHYKSLSMEQLLREAHANNIGDTRSVYTPSTAL